MSDQTFHDGRVELLAGDCLERLKGLADNSVDAVATDPPYHLTSIVKRFGGENAAPNKDYVGEREGATGAYARASKGFMGKTWDGGDIAFRVELWREVFRVLKPGGHLVAFSATRTYHRMTVAIEDAGFEVRDMIAWLYGVGFPKSHDVSKGIDKMLGAEREKVRVAPRPETSGTMAGSSDTRPWIEQSRIRGYHEVAGDVPVTDSARSWEGWGTALKPALEPVCFARKPLSEKSVAANVLRWGTGAINIDACKIEAREARQTATGGMSRKSSPVFGEFSGPPATRFETTEGRWPANVAHDGSQEVMQAFPETHSAGAARSGSSDPRQQRWTGNVGNAPNTRSTGDMFRIGDSGGSAARFFYSAKADADDRLGSDHPTVKPLDLMRWLVRLITPAGGRVLDPFGGTGTTGHAALLEGFSAVLIEREDGYRQAIARRLENAFAADRERRALIAKAKNKVKGPGALFETPEPGLEPAGQVEETIA